MTPREILEHVTNNVVEARRVQNQTFRELFPEGTHVRWRERAAGPILAGVVRCHHHSFPQLAVEGKAGWVTVQAILNVGD